MAYLDWQAQSDIKFLYSWALPDSNESLFLDKAVKLASGSKLEVVLII